MSQSTSMIKRHLRNELDYVLSMETYYLTELKSLKRRKIAILVAIEKEKRNEKK